jgi:hypothetical protein
MIEQAQQHDLEIGEELGKYLASRLRFNAVQTACGIPGCKMFNDTPGSQWICDRQVFRAAFRGKILEYVCRGIGVVTEKRRAQA